MGKARLERAVAQQDRYDVRISWLPFFLRPGMPKEGKAKGGTPATRVGGWLRDLNAKEPGINFTGLCDRYPNTELYHVALEHVIERHGAAAQHALASRLFEAYYHDGLYPDEGTLVALAAELLPALDAAALRAALRDPRKADEVVARARQLARQMEVTGVPFFVVNGAPAFSGAQPAAAFLQAFEAAA